MVLCIFICVGMQLEPGTELSFERVLAVKGDGELQIGQPYVSGALCMLNDLHFPPSQSVQKLEI